MDNAQTQKLILIVDDDPEMAQLMSVLLERNKTFRTDYAPSGAIAIEKAVSLQPALIMLDNMMPEMTGLPPV